MNKADHYVNPLVERYGSTEMNYIFSPENKFSTWRKLWLYLAEAQKKAGLPITLKQLEEMRKNLYNIDFKYAQIQEKKLRHDVMAHVHTFAKVCPKAAPIIHWGVTSAYVGDNTDLIQLKQATELIHKKLLLTLYHLRNFVNRYKALPTLAYTHFQSAQPTTVGKRACLWLQDFLLDHQRLLFFLNSQLCFRGVKGTTGTQASFKKLFKNNLKKVQEIEQYIAKQFGFNKILTITGQTYTRKIDYEITALLSTIAQSAAKFAGDIRLLSHKKEIEEPFEQNQIGSSAMAYKRNPMRTERIHSLARFIMAIPQTTSYTASTQWFERTLDDSANKRIAIPQAFLALDAVLDLLNNVIPGLVVYPKMINQNLMSEFPFMVTENVMMESTKRGCNRQVVHEEIRKLSWQVSEEIKAGKSNRLIELMAKSQTIPLGLKEIEELANIKEHIGFSKELAETFIQHQVTPVLKKHRFPKKSSAIRV